MRLPPLQLGPWPKGVDSYHDATHAVFQPTKDRLASLTEAVNVDLDDEGWPTLRAGLTEEIAATGGGNIFSGAGLLLLQLGDSIKSVDTSSWSTTDLVTGLDTSKRVRFHEHLNQVFWSNTEETGRVDSSATALNWGCATAPTPTLGTTAGNLDAGRYMVAALFVDSSGIEHSANKAAVVSLDGTKDITATLSSVDANAAYVKFYATKPNGTGLFWVKTVAATALPATISDVEVSDEPLRTLGLSPPLAGDGMFTYRGFLIIFAEQYLFPSYGPNVHLYEISDVIEARPENILAGAGLASGFWTVCANGLYWTQGDRPEEWVTLKRDDRKYAAGAKVVPGYYISSLQTREDVAIFVSEDGLIAGMPDGRVFPLTFDQLSLDVVGKRAEILIRKTGDLRQIIFSLLEN